VAHQSLGSSPTSTTDESKVPHYFGPYPNWAYSPQTLADAVVTFSGGGGSGASATATVDPKTGAISGIDVTTPGSGYTATPDVVITAPGITPTAAASATAVVSSGAVKSVSVDENGFGFTDPVVAFTGGNPDPGGSAAATASGGVDNVSLTDGGTGYTLQPVVEFSLPDLASGTRATGSATMDGNGVVTGIDVVDPGSGYVHAPTVTILDGTQVNATAATAIATIDVTAIDLTSPGAGYDSAPTVTVLDSDGTDRGASATATVAAKGSVTDVVVQSPGAGYLTPGLKKFVDTLPGLGDTAANDLGEYIPVAVPDTTSYPGTDYYEIAVVQYRHKFHKDLPATLLRGYVQLSTSVIPGKQLPLANANLDPSQPDTPILDADGKQYTAVDTPSYLGPTIVATKNRPVRVLFRNLLPTGVDGNLFLPVDTTLMGSGSGPDMMKLDANNVPMDMAKDEGSVLDGVRNPMCGDIPKPRECYSENRATLHLHGGITPWISDGTPHQWTTPSGEDTAYPKGVSVENVPDMPDPGPGAETFFYTNQQSARLMFYHDHAWGITRLNVYAGEAAGYLLTDDMEQQLEAPGGALAGLGNGTPLVIQDKTFVPDNVLSTDPTWDKARWGGTGSLWSPHVYMPAQNPDSPTGVSAFGRWMYGPYFWPPADPKYPPIANPYYDPTCDPDVEPFCEPKTIPSTPNVSVGMEAFNDTPVVNGVAYPATTVDPKAYRFRILNAANDRFWNLQWYVADPTTGTLSEVALKSDEVAAAQTDPNIAPTPDTTKSPAGPSWVQIGTEGGFLPTPTVVPNQPTTWITDPTRFDFGNVDKHALLLAPAERADTIVDFSQFRGKTLILYNDAPAAFPARQANQDFYTGDPDLSPGGAPSTLPGYGPNTRTIMQVKVSTGAPAVAWDRPNTTNDRMGQLMAAFQHHTDANGKPAGVFESASDPIVVGQADYNRAYGTSFSANGYCGGATPAAKCDGYARIQQQGGDPFTFDTLTGKQLSIPLQPKAIHDEMNSASFDEWGRMTANLGLEAPGATPLNQNIILYPYVNPSTEDLDTSGLPSSLQVTPISSASDGTQIWKITHNGVDTHPIHFHLYDVQVLNRVTWDNIIIPPDPNELGWKDTVRVSPLEDTIVAVRPIVPTLPFGVPDSTRPLNPMMPIGARGSVAGQTGTQGVEAGFNNTDANGNPIDPIVNTVTDFGWEYVWHCHILSHEEMDMMRPVTVHVPTQKPEAPALTFTRGSVDLKWTDGTPVDYADPTTWTNPGTAEIGYRIERAEVTDGVPAAFVRIGTALANSTSYSDTTNEPTTTYDYRVVAWNQAGSTASNTVRVEGVPKAPTAFTAVIQPDPTLPAGAGVALGWTNNATNATNVVVERDSGTGFTVLATLAPTDTAYVDTTVLPGSYSYRVKAINAFGDSSYAGPASVTVGQPGSATVVLNAPDPSFVGQEVTFTATVSAVQAAAMPTSSVLFTVDGATAASPVLDANGVARFTISTLAAGTHTVTAAYSGDAIFAKSSATVTQTVNRYDSVITLTSDRNPSTVGDLVSFTATVSAGNGGGVPTGSVGFTVNGGPPVVLPVDASGVASFATSALPVGDVTVAADYSGDASFNAASVVTTQSVNKLATGTVLTSDRNPSRFGDLVNFTASVSPPDATGTVTFTIDGTFAGTLPVVGGSAALPTSGLPVGTHVVSADYSGDGTHLSSTAATLTQTVGPVLRPTTVVVTSSANPAGFGQPVTMTATVRPITGTGTPTGSVQFTLDGRTAGGPVPLTAQGRASLPIGSPSAGAHTVIAVYSGSTEFAGSGSTPFVLTVQQGVSTTTLTANRTRAVSGQAVTFTARVSPLAATGAVTFTVDGTIQGGGVPLDAAGAATLSLATLAPGIHAVAAAYGGSPNYLPSNSRAVSVTVRKATTRTVLTSNGTPAPRGTAVVFTAAVAAVAPGSGVPGGTVQFQIDGRNSGAAVTVNSSGQAAMVTSTLAIGRHTVVAVYSGDGRFTTSTSTTLVQRIR
jgi:FtsP/CotA-like multicopper oxidase with cupredoxin domain